jgi:hypothetical protein
VSNLASNSVPLEERRAILARSLQQETHQGWRVLSQTDTQAQLVRGKRVNHLLHLVLTLLTLGLWVVVWILVTAWGGEKTRYVTVTEYGQIQWT